MKQHFALGQYLRKRYIDGQPFKLLSKEYDRFQVSFVAHLLDLLFCVFYVWSLEQATQFMYIVLFCCLMYYSLSSCSDH